MMLKKFSKQPSKKTKKIKNQENNTQSNDRYSVNFLPIREVRGGIIITNDGRYIKILEIQPTNFRQKQDYEQERIISNFQRIFAICPVKIMFYTTSAKADVSEIIENVKRHTYTSDNELLRKGAEDYVKTIRSIQEYAGITTRYFIIFEYDGDGEEKTTDFRRIYDSICNTQYAIQSVLRDCGNTIVENSDNYEPYFQLEILYSLYNRRSSITETLNDRIERLNYDAEIYSAHLKRKKSYTVGDYIAPRGIDIGYKDMILIDGVWHTYFGIKDNAYPPVVAGGWLDMFSQDAGIDVAVVCKKQSNTMAEAFLSRHAVLSMASANSARDPRKQEQYYRRAENSNYILNKLKEGENLFKIVTIFCVWGTDPHEVLRIRNSIISDMKSHQIHVEKAQYDCDKFMRCSSPLMTYNSELFRRLGKDILSSGLSAFYNYTKLSLFDSTGYVLGSNRYNGSIVAYNNFNSSTVKNANISIVGTSGAGKTYLELLISRRSRMVGFNTYFVLPVKGHEYYKPIKSIGGQIVRLFPGSESCINIMEIYPEGEFSDIDLDDDDTDGYEQSLLTKKIAELTTWIQLRLGSTYELRSTDRALLNKLFSSIYSDYGITTDNNSIFDSNGRLREMPTLKTLYDYARDNIGDYPYVVEILEDFIHGQYSNFVGQTNVDLSNPCIAFDVDERIIGKDNLASIMYIAFTCAYNLAITNREHSSIIFDEVWKMTTNPECAEQVVMMSKLIRGYGGGIITATQELTDFLKNGGEAIINNAKTKIILNLEHEEALKISKILSLNDEDIGLIESFSRGQGLLMANGLKVPIKITGSNLETKLFTPTKK